MPRYPHLKKAALRAAVLDTPTGVTLTGSPVDYETCRWVGRHPDRARAALGIPAPGIDGRLPWPGIASVHLAVRTSDGFLLAAQRSATAASYPSAWSVSLEEQSETGDGADADLDAAVTRAVSEERGARSAHGPCARAHLIGRELSQDGEPMGIAIVAVVELACSFDEVADSLADAPDAAEAQQLAGIRPGPVAVIDLATTCGPKQLAAATGGDYRIHRLVPTPGEDLGWHPTAAVRWLIANASA
jgi:hypothetical protein